jgi:hypothetical protein
MLQQELIEYKEWCIKEGLNPKEGKNIRRYLEWKKLNN